MRQGDRPELVLVVDDDLGLQRLVRLALEVTERFIVVGTAGDGTGALEVISQVTPDIVVVDLGLPDVAGLDLIPRIHDLAPGARIVIFTGDAEISDRILVGMPTGTRLVIKGDLEQLLHALEPTRTPAVADVAATFEADPAAARQARCFVSDACETWGLDGLIPNVALVVSELVTNAVVHAQSSFEVRLRRSSELLRVEVHDRSTETVPDPRAPDVYDEDGRGLILVSALSCSWGIEPSPVGKTVWAEIPLSMS